MINKSLFYDCYRFETAVRVTWKTRDMRSMVHSPAVFSCKVLPDISPLETSFGSEFSIPFWVIVQMVNAEKIWVRSWPLKAKGIAVQYLRSSLGFHSSLFLFGLFLAEKKSKESSEV